MIVVAVTISAKHIVLSAVFAKAYGVSGIILSL
jgi:hypothetical protein